MVYFPYTINMVRGMQGEINRLHSMNLLDKLLCDMTTGKNIIWATDAYNSATPPLSLLSDEYKRDREITSSLLLQGAFRLMSRAEKARCEQSERTKTHAEVFTPFWVVKKMNDYMEAQWFGYESPFDADRVVFPEGKTWKQFVDSRRMEITCGEAPYLVTRYDVSNGTAIPLHERAGILDRKLRVVSENAAAEEWLTWAYRAFQATYGYEFQGDNLLLSRVNLLLTFEEYMEEYLHRKPSQNEYEEIINILTWNIWQMDGLTGTIPYGKIKEESPQMALFDNEAEAAPENIQPSCRVFDWQAMKDFEYRKLKEAKK